MAGKNLNVKTSLIINPVASRIASAEKLARVEEALNRRGHPVTVSYTSAPLEAIEIARRAAGEGSGLVISVGGDGTLNEVINGIAGTPARLGIIPAGLSNVLARELDIPDQLDRALEIILAGKARPLDLGLINDRYFSIMVSVGIDAEAVRIVNPAVKRFLKRYAYHLAGFQALASFRPAPFTLRCDGEKELTGRAAVISNSRFYGGPHQITPQARSDDGLLHCCVFARGRRRDYARYFWGVLRKNHHRFRDVSFLTARTVDIETPGLPIQADGDYLGRTPARIRIFPGMLTVLAPKKNE